MALEMGETVKIFCSYSPKDADLKRSLKSHLQYYEYISYWDDELIQPGMEWENEVEKSLATADIILLLISPDFPSSSLEVKSALERHSNKEARVIPIILRPVDWKSTSFGKLQPLPRDGNAVVMCDPQDKALYEIAKEILSVAKEIFITKCMKIIALYRSDERYEDALRVCDEAIHVDCKNASLYQCKGDILFQLERFKEAFDCYYAAFQIEPQNAQLWREKGRALAKLERYDDALSAYKHATELLPSDAGFKIEIGDIYLKLNRSTEALTAYDKAISLEPNTALFHMKRGDALRGNNGRRRGSGRL